MVAKFGASAEQANWGIVGWSMGGTCAVDLTVMHPGMFSSFLDVAGDLYPNAGNEEETISRLFGGDAAAWAAFDPTTVITRHGPYTGVAGWFAIPARRELPIADISAMRLAGRDAAANPSNQTSAANALCALGRSYGIDCAVIPQPGKHDWPFADQAFATALPWLAGRLGTPGVPRIPLPGTVAPPTLAGPGNAQVVAAGR
jgi:S-formylglutathione hydrolase FrmB